MMQKIQPLQSAVHEYYATRYNKKGANITLAPFCLAINDKVLTT